MSSASDPSIRPSESEGLLRAGLGWKYLGDAGRGLFFGICLGLFITFVVGLLGAVMGHYCLVPVPPGWCPW